MTPTISINGNRPDGPIILSSPVSLPIDQMRTKKHLFISNNAQGKLPRSTQADAAGLLLGKVYQHGTDVYSSIEDIILANTRGATTFDSFSPVMWDEMRAQLRQINETRSADDQLIIAGWFHVLSQNISVHMNGADRSTQGSNFFQDWQVGLVMNPRTEIAKAYFGKMAEEGKISYFDFQNIVENQNQVQSSNEVLTYWDPINNIQIRWQNNQMERFDSGQWIIAGYNPTWLWDAASNSWWQFNGNDYQVFTPQVYWCDEYNVTMMCHESMPDTWLMWFENNWIKAPFYPKRLFDTINQRWYKSNSATAQWEEEPIQVPFSMGTYE